MAARCRMCYGTSGAKPVREIVLDTETTGFDPETGDRIVEIGAVELNGHVPTGRVFHEYVNPERSMPDDAKAVHGLDDEFLRDKPLFREVGAAFLAFIGDSQLIIHNASFDMKFLNAELRWIGLSEIPHQRAVDTLAIARKKFPGAPASLDALCRRFGIDNSSRTLHGALLDSEILAEVYLELIGGRQPDFGLSQVRVASSAADDGPWRPGARHRPLSERRTDEERRAHDEFVAALGEDALWLKS